jgi:hypothetical protein
MEHDMLRHLLPALFWWSSKDWYCCLAALPNRDKNKCSTEFPNMPSALRPVAQSGEFVPEIRELRKLEDDADVDNKEMDVDYTDREPYLITHAS